MSDRTTPGVLIAAVLLTISFSVIFGFVSYGKLKTHYSENHHVEPRVVQKFFGGTYEVEGDVTFNMIGARSVLTYVVLPSIIYILIHAILGRVIAGVARFLWEVAKKVYSFEFERLSTNCKLIFGVMWPITMLSVPLLVVAIMLGTLFRVLWK